MATRTLTTMKIDDNFDLILAEYQRINKEMPELRSDMCEELNTRDSLVVTQIIAKIKEVILSD